MYMFQKTYFLHEVAKSQGIPCTAMEDEIRTNLRMKRVTEDVLEVIVSNAESGLEELGIRLVDY